MCTAEHLHQHGWEGIEPPLAATQPCAEVRGRAGGFDQRFAGMQITAIRTPVCGGQSASQLVRRCSCSRQEMRDVF